MFKYAASTFVAPPMEQTLRAYVAFYSSRDVADVFLALGADPVLAERVDQRLQTLPMDLVARLATYLQRPIAEVQWAAGGSALVAPSQGNRRRTY